MAKKALAKDNPKRPATAKKARSTRRQRLDAKLQEATRLASEGDFVRAERLLLQILKAHPKEVGAWDALGFVQFFQGRFAEAQECCERSMYLSPANAYAHKGWGLCVAKQGRIDDGLESLEHAMDLAPGWFDPYWDFLVVCGEARRPKEARRVLAMARARFPERGGELDELVAHFRK